MPVVEFTRRGTGSWRPPCRGPGCRATHRASSRVSALRASIPVAQATNRRLIRSTAPRNGRCNRDHRRSSLSSSVETLAPNRLGLFQSSSHLFRRRPTTLNANTAYSAHQRAGQQKISINQLIAFTPHAHSLLLLRPVWRPAPLYAKDAGGGGRGRRRKEPEGSLRAAVRQIRPRAAMLTVSVRDTTMWSSRSTSISSRRSFVRPVNSMSLGLGSAVPDGWLW